MFDREDVIYLLTEAFEAVNDPRRPIVVTPDDGQQFAAIIAGRRVNVSVDVEPDHYDYEDDYNYWRAKWGEQGEHEQ